VYGGLAEINGILRGGKEGLILDFELKESVLHALRLDAKVTTLPLSEIAGIELKKGWFSRWLILRANRLETLRPLPGSKGAELRLKIARQNAAAAEELVSQVQLTLATNGIKSMLKEMRVSSGSSSPAPS